MFPPRGIDPDSPLKIHSNSPGARLTTVSASRKTEAPPKEEDDTLLARAREDFSRCVAWESKWREKARKELEFVDALEHWDPGMKTERAGRPCLVFDRIGPSIDQVVNDARQNPPEPRVSAVGAGADKETADIVQGMLRNIDQDSSAIIAYLTAYEHAVKIGRGWWRIDFAWENDGLDLDASSFQQKIVIKRVRNPFSVYPDPGAVELDYSDMGYCFVTENLSLRAYKEQYPDSMVSGLSSFESIGDNIRGEWFSKGDVRIAEYWWVEKEKYEIAQLENGLVVLAKDAPPDARVVNRRQMERRKVCGARINGIEVLERWTWPGRWIPLIPVIGKEIMEADQITLRGMVRPAMDSNLSFDYVMSKEIETIGLSSIVQWMVAEGQIENFEYQWAQANRKPLPFLYYKNQVNGKDVAPPQRIFSTPPLQAMTEAIAQLDEAGKANLATWNPNLGGPSPESSGRAITARQREADNAHFNYHDNLMRSMRFSGRQELDLIPHIYSEERMVTVLNPDGSNRQVLVNGPMVEKGVEKIYQMKGAARCDLAVGSGPSYASRRAEGADKLMQVAPIMPQLIQRAPDLVIKALDVPDGDAIADRIRPADIQQETEGQAPIPPQIQNLIGQQQEAIKTLTAELSALKQVLDGKVLDIESRERVATQHEEHQDYRAALASKEAIASEIVDKTHDHMQAELDRRADLLHTHLTLEQEARLAAMPPPAPAQPGAPPAGGPGSPPPAPAGPTPPGALAPDHSAFQPNHAPFEPTP